MKTLKWLMVIMVGLCLTINFTCSTWAIIVDNKVTWQPKITQMATQVHTNFRNLVLVQRLQTPNALQQQREFLLAQPEVAEVTQLKGHNLFVKFKDGNELLMLLGEDRLGMGFDSKDNIQVAEVQTQNPAAEVQMQNQPLSPSILKPVEEMISDAVLKPILLCPCSPNSNKALIFDCMEDDKNVVSPKISVQVKTNLEAMGYVVTSQLNNNANLANAALIDNGEYGVVMMRGHGADLGGDFGFFVRPWYTSYPPASSYVGTIRGSAYNHAANATQFCYVITGQFTSTYWTNLAFPNSMFFLESCHGTDPGALPGMPKWTIDHGACVWLGWDESVSFNCGDNGTKLFFQKMKDGKTVGEAVAAVAATGCRPPDLTAYPSGKGGCKLAVWKSDPNERPIADNRDFKLMKLVASANLCANITFYTVPSFDEFFFYVDTGGSAAPEVCIRCHMDNFEVYKQTAPGLYNNKVYTGTPGISGTNYSLTIPWNTAFGAVSSVNVWLYDMAGKDCLPNTGRVTVKK